VKTLLNVCEYTTIGQCYNNFLWSLFTIGLNNLVFVPGRPFQGWKGSPGPKHLDKIKLKNIELHNQLLIFEEYPLALQCLVL